MSGILCLFSAPLIDGNKNPIPLLEYEKEELAIRKCYEKGNIKKYKSRFATTKELIQSINEGYNILHLSGHGSEEYLYFENGRGGIDELHIDEIKEIFEDLVEIKELDLITISACHSEKIAKIFFDLGVKNVIAVKTAFAVYDKFATLFFESFYENFLKNKKSIKTSFDNAKKILKFDSEWKLYKKNNKENPEFIDEEKKYLMLYLDSSFEYTIMESSVQREITDCFGKKINNIASQRPEIFTGRTTEIYEIIQLIRENRIATIKGAGGVGKTTIAMEVARWFLHRDMFDDGIFFIDTRKEQSINNIMKKTADLLNEKVKDFDDFFLKIKNKEVLLVFDNAEDVILTLGNEFRDFIGSLILNTKVKCIITTQKEMSSIYCQNERSYDLIDLSKSEIYQLIKKKIVNVKNIEHPKFLEILEMLGGNPLAILITIENINKGYKIETIIEELKEGNIYSIENKIKMRENSLNIALELGYKKLSPKAQELIKILSYFPTGVHYKNLEEFIYKGKIETLLIELKSYSFIQNIENDRIRLQPSIFLFGKSKITKLFIEEYEKRFLEYIYALMRFIERNFGGKNHRDSTNLFYLEKQNILTVIKETAHDKQVLEIKNEITISLLLLCNELGEVSETLNIAKDILELFEKEENYIGKGYVYNLVANAYLILANNCDAKINLEKAMEIFEEYSCDFGKISSYLALAAMKNSLSEYDEAIKICDKGIELCIGENEHMKVSTYELKFDAYIQKLLLKEAEEILNEIFKKINNKDSQLIRNNTYKAKLLLAKNECLESKKYLEKALETSKKINYYREIEWILNKLIENCFEEKNKLEAVEYWNELKLYWKPKSKHEQNRYIVTEGEIEFLNGNIEEANRKYLEGLSYFEKYDDYYSIVYICIRIAELCKEIENYTDMNKYLQKGLLISRNTGNKLNERKILNSIYCMNI